MFRVGTLLRFNGFRGSDPIKNIEFNLLDKKKAKEVITSGLIGLFIIVSFWGIIKVVTDTFGVGPERLNERAIPCIPNQAAGIDCN